MTKQQNVDDYIKSFPDDVQKILNEMRSVIKKLVPKAEEVISYGIPTFKLNGSALIYFAGFKNHVSIYPAPRGNELFRKELAAYKGGKGTVQFPLDEKIPFDLIKRIVKFKVKESDERTKAKVKK